MQGVHVGMPKAEIWQTELGSGTQMPEEIGSPKTKARVKSKAFGRSRERSKTRLSLAFPNGVLSLI